ncbi:hypothetical protein ACRRTK_003648 [Alexandromys fortis]
MSSLRDRHGRTIWFKDLPLSSKTISRTRRDRKHTPKSIAQQSEGTSLQQNQETATAPKKGKRRGLLFSSHRSPQTSEEE